MFGGLGRRFRFGLGPDALALFYAMFFWELGYGCYSAIQTLFIKSLGGSDVEIGLLIAIQGVVRVALTLPSGVLADKFSRRKLMIWATAAGIPACVVAGLAQTWRQMLPGLILLLVANIATPAMSAYIAQISTKDDRARNFSFIYTIGPASGLIIAPALGGLLAEHVAMRSIYFASAFLYLIATFCFSRVSERPLIRTEHAAPTYREALGNPAVRWIAVLMFSVLAVSTLGVTFLPNYLSEAKGLSVGSIGRLFSIAAIGTVLLTQAFTRFRWVTPARGVAIGTVAVAAACVVTMLTGNIWVLAAAFLGRGGFMVAWTLIYVVLGDVTPDRLRARAFALTDFLGGIGVGLTPFAAGAIYGWHRAAPLVMIGCLAPCIAVGAFVLERKLIHPAHMARLRELDIAPATA